MLASGADNCPSTGRRMPARPVRGSPGRCVMRFLSTYQGKLDGKGRVLVPAPFRAVLEADRFSGLLTYPALDLPALECGGNALLREIDGLIARYPSHSEIRDLVATALLGGAETLRMDPEGRISFPDRFAEHAGISAGLVFVGMGDRFRIWEPNRFSAHIAEANAKLRQLRAELSSGVEISSPAKGGRVPGAGDGER